VVAQKSDIFVPTGGVQRYKSGWWCNGVVGGEKSVFTRICSFCEITKKKGESQINQMIFVFCSDKNRLAISGFVSAHPPLQPTHRLYSLPSSWYPFYRCCAIVQQRFLP